ncbi:LysM peptidoglycan-binding domain-containing protein [Longispora fulva]|uniref:LysM repeat protein n=1 Tax=Longispora fulva TaxID=619741 RepID=A0A8J7GK27_9ACTN|nr:LysM peptidoglycan-binding domain-containing protein [Longispora fulva]MBG6138068.1 LysM repeat protein [Longispora fulva]
MLTTLMTAVFLGGLALAAPTSVASGVPSESRVAVVRPGDSLWSVAVRELPGMDTYRAVRQLREINDLDDGVVQPGQHLVLPVRG